MSNLTTPTPAQTKAAIEMIVAIGQAIRELGSIPSGHLYAQLTGKLSLGEYEKIISILKNAKVVKEVNYLLIWTGPGAEINN